MKPGTGYAKLGQRAETLEEIADIGGASDRSSRSRNAQEIRNIPHSRASSNKDHMATGVDVISDTLTNDPGNHSALKKNIEMATVKEKSVLTKRKEFKDPTRQQNRDTYLTEIVMTRFGADRFAKDDGLPISR